MLEIAQRVLMDLLKAKRPVLLFGWGVRLAKADVEAREIARLLNIPVVTTWGAADMFPGAIGSFGTHGVRAANFAVQNSDYILAVGSRLDTKATGAPPSSFAPNAKLVMVDIDQDEIAKMAKIGRRLHLGIHSNAAVFLKVLEFLARGIQTTELPWVKQIRGWQEKYPVVTEEYRKQDGINPYVFMESLSEAVREDDVIVSDTGCSLAWAMQAFKFRGQRFIHALNQTPMGYGLPAAVGAAFASGKRVILLTGDGGLSLNLSEMATVERHKLPVKIVLFNNLGHAMCRQTQRQWLKGEYPSTSYEGGLANPNFFKIADAYGFRVFSAKWKDQAQIMLERLLEDEVPSFLELEIDGEQGVTPQARFGFPIEDQEPPLSREELAKIMEAA